MKKNLIVVFCMSVFCVIAFALSPKASSLSLDTIYLIGENHSSPEHQKIKTHLIKLSSEGHIYIGVEGVNYEVMENIKKSYKKNTVFKFFGIDNDILYTMGAFLTSYILLHKPTESDQKEGHKYLYFMFNNLSPLLNKALKNLNISFTERLRSPYEPETIKKIAQEMSLIAKKEKLVSQELLDIYNYTIENPKDYDSFSNTFVSSARYVFFVKNIVHIFEKAKKEKKLMFVYVGAGHLDSLKALLSKQGIKVKNYDLQNRTDLSRVARLILKIEYVKKKNKVVYWTKKVLKSCIRAF